MPDRMEMLRDASERATPGGWQTNDGGGIEDTLGHLLFQGGNDWEWNEKAADDAAFATLAVNFVRDLLSGTWPDQEAVDEVFAEDVVVQACRLGVRASPTESPGQWRDRVRWSALTAALGLTEDHPIARLNMFDKVQP